MRAMMALNVLSEAYARDMKRAMVAPRESWEKLLAEVRVARHEGLLSDPFEFGEPCLDTHAMMASRTTQ